VPEIYNCKWVLPGEADAVLGGAVTASLVGQPVASALVSMTDFAHTYAAQVRDDHDLFVEAFRSGQVPGVAATESS